MAVEPPAGSEISKPHREVLHDLGKELAAELDMSVVVQKVVDSATRLLGAQAGAFLSPARHRERDGDVVTFHDFADVMANLNKYWTVMEMA